jgi:uncharacterized membrane protein YdjX (TVP38/TMEM64 family)
LKRKHKKAYVLDDIRPNLDCNDFLPGKDNKESRKAGIVRSEFFLPSCFPYYLWERRDFMQATDHADAPAPKRAWLRWLVLALILAGLGGFYAFDLHEYFGWDYVRSHLDDLKAEVGENLVVALIVFFALYAVMAALSVPAAGILTMVGGALFGRFLGGGTALLAATVGATLAFLSSRFLLRDWLQARLGHRMEAFNRGFEKDGVVYLFSLRLVPLFPFWLINLAMGLTPIRTWTYFWVSLIGMLPGSLIYANAGHEIGSIEKPSDILTPGVIVSLVLLGIAPLVFRKLMAWRR